MKPGIWELLILLVIILLLFGTKKLRNAGGDIGSAFKNFKKAVKDEDKKIEEKHSEDHNADDQAEDADFDKARQQEKSEHNHNKQS